MARPQLAFHPRCGKHVRVTEEGMRVERTSLDGSTNGELVYGGVLTARPLKTSEIFKVQLSITSRPQLSLGITIHNPEKIKFLDTMSKLKGTWCLVCGAEGWIYINGDVVNDEFLSHALLDALKDGDTLGLQVTHNGELNFFVNGSDVGIAAVNIPKTVFGFVDLWDLSCPAINLISEKVGPPTKAPPHATPAHKKEKEKRERKHRELKATPMHEKEKERIRERKGREPKKSDIQSTTALFTPTQEKEKNMDGNFETSTVREIAFSELEFGDSLGIGGQGAVFKGQWKTKRLSLVVAIKRVLGKIRDEEAEILSKLSHPNVITFYGVCTDRHPEYFIITELAEGGSLYTLIHKKLYLPTLEESLQWAKEIAEGMSYLHQQKVIHRDLKSHNVLLTASLTTKLCDFGSAKEFDHTTIQTGTGTYRWIAPEVLKGEKVSLSCDVFSYGMVLIELFKRELPFAGINDLKVAGMISEGETPAIPVSLVPYIANLMKCCWQFNPKIRPSFEEILVILKNKECPEPMNESTGTADSEGSTADGKPNITLLTLKDLSQLQTSLEEASVVWYPLGMKLKFDSKTLAEIATASGNDPSVALGIMLMRWLKDKDQHSVLESLTTALSSPDIGLSKLSEVLVKNFA